jgi:purine-nucleoside phosphorylase
MANLIKSKTSSINPKVAIICGSGLGNIADAIGRSNIIPYIDIPDFPRSTGNFYCIQLMHFNIIINISNVTVAGHKGNLIFGELGGVEVVCMQGRFHPYEGYSSALCAMPMRIFSLLGCKIVVITNAAGAINSSYKIGDLMLIKDHISFPMLSLSHPLVGPNDERFGPRFLPVNNIYSKNLRDLMREVGDEKNIDLLEGIYGSIGGPTYETVSDIRLCKTVGMDVVGMSTTHEAVVALHSGMKVVAITIVTDKVCVEFDSEGSSSDHSEIVKIADKKSKDAEVLVIAFLQKLNKTFLN